MIDLARLFDAYGRQARLYPALFTFLPAIVFAAALFPSLLLGSVGPALVAVAVACGAIFLLADVARSRGRRLEPLLRREWGGWPTTIWLRHGSDHLPAPTRARYHAHLAANIPGLSFPTEHEEASDPTAADAMYSSAIEWLKERARGDALVERENASYGFRRNMLGMKPVGIAIALLSIVGGLLIAASHERQNATILAFIRSAVSGTPATIFGSITLSIVVLIIWLFVVNRSWVRDAGNAYARALLAMCDRPT